MIRGLPNLHWLALQSPTTHCLALHLLLNLHTCINTHHQEGLATPTVAHLPLISSITTPHLVLYITTLDHTLLPPTTVMVSFPSCQVG